MRSALLLLALAGCTSAAAAPSDAGTPDASDGGSFAKRGAVEVTAYSYPVGSHTFSGGSVGASFVDATGFASPACTTTHLGACDLSLCGTTSDAGAPEPLAAGAVAVDGVTGGPLTLTPTGTAYVPVTSAALLFAAGDALTASAPGDPQGAPAFQRAVKAPSYVFVSEPPFPGTGPIGLDRTKDLPVVWSNGTIGTTVVTLSGAGFLLQCSAAASAGKLTVPAAALGNLPQIAAAGAETFSVSTLMIDHRAAGSAGDWGIDLRVTAVAARPGGTASAPLLLP
ncbi:MAG TPA: hypothetical protein VF316_21285 [Polyangiaceae bacterium]